jgi:phosphoglycerate dehydrogenase-like enzyme
MTMRVAVTDDWQDVSRSCATWEALQARADVVWFTAPFADDDAAVAALADFDVLVPMRDRTKLPAAFLRRLPRLKLIAQTGMLALHIDVPYCDAHGVLICGSVAENLNVHATPELTLGLILAASHHIARGDANMRAGRFQQGIGFGETLAGGTMGVIGLGNIGKRMVEYGRMLGMEVLAWSPNMTAERATAAGATSVSKAELMSRSDVVTLHLVHADSTVGIIGAADLARMKPGAMFVNTARGALVDEAALIEALAANRITAALDVYEREPLPADHPLRTLPNTVLTPHLGFIKRDAFTGFYTQSVENVLAWLDGAPRRVLNPQYIGRKAS